MAKFVTFNDEVLGRLCTEADITAKVLDATACGAEGVLFVRDDGSFGVEEVAAVYIVEADDEDGAAVKAKS